MAKIALLGDLDQTSPLHKIRSRHDLNMVGTLVESLGFIVAEKIIFNEISTLFVPFCKQNCIIQIGKN